MGNILDSKLLTRLLHNGRDGGVVNMAGRRKQMVLDLVAQAATYEVPEKGAAAEIGCSFDLKFGPIH